MCFCRLYSIIVAVDKRNGIGLNGNIPWKKIRKDLQHFKNITTNTIDANKKNAIIMGRVTFESIPEQFRPLSNRINIVISTTLQNIDGVHIVRSLDDAFKFVATLEGIEHTYVIGGGKVYNECLEKYSELCYSVIMTNIEATFNCDVFFPTLDNNFELESQQEPDTDEYPYQINTYIRSNHEEKQYLQLINDIINRGVRKGDRTNVGTVSIFGAQMRFSLRNGKIPLLTTKTVFWKAVALELLWFIKGDTNAKNLSNQGVKIWDANGSREALDRLGFNNRQEGDLGPVYGFQWRHFGAEYVDMDTDYKGKGIDQLQNLIETIKTNPNDRRMILCAWNPCHLNLMALPPCHCMAQFYVAEGELYCQMYQRSCDMGLGVPFNIASYSLLTHLIAKVTGLKAGEFIHTLGDAHVYSNHIEPLKTQLTRIPRQFPTLNIKRDVQNIDDFLFSDLEILDYRPHTTIKMKMAV